MKPLMIEFQAFGPYSGYEKVDFSSLSSKGLFLICGKTGSGKTMILDAMTFALYGKSSTHGRDEFESLRCTKADESIPTFVKFTFENNGEQYIFERRLERKRKNLSTSYNVMKLDSEGVFKPLFENAKEKSLNEKAIEIIGLEYEQFRQVIVLPQGQFEKFLTSGSDEKEKILTSIFGEEKWKYIAEKFYEEVSNRKDNLKEQKNKIIFSLREENCESISELSEIIEEKSESIKNLESDFNNTGYDSKIKMLQKELVTIKRFGDLQRAEEKISELNNLQSRYEKLQTDINEALRAQKVKPFLDEKAGSKENFDNRTKTLESLREQKETSKEKYEKVLEENNEHLNCKEAIEKKENLKIELESKRNVYEEIEDVRKGLEAAKEEERLLFEKEKFFEAEFNEMSSEVLNVKYIFDEYTKNHSQLMDAYLAGITGEIASKLVEGKPCPVCGSTSHPCKASLSEDSVSREMVDAAKKKADSESKKLETLSKRQEDSKQLLEKMHSDTEEKRKEVLGQGAKLEGMTKSLVEGIDSLKKLNEKVQKLDREVAEFSEKKVALESKKESLLKEYTENCAKESSAQNEAEDAKKNYDRASETLKTALEQNGFISEEEARTLFMNTEQVEALQKEVSEYKAGLKAARENLDGIKEELKDVQKPDEEKINAQLEEIEKAKSEYAKMHGVLEKEIERLCEKRDRLEKECFGIDDKIRQAEEDFAFAKKLRGDSGTGLQRYVMGVMFSSVVASANKMLELVHGGRYRLYRSDEKNTGSVKRGLELKVFDRNSENHDGRFVNTLSGGEKFLTSLALSIGMSTVATKTGINIEVLFIDEGFGSLDDDSISDAMEILNSIQKANGIVGIISHVSILQDQISAKLKIEENETGSHIVETVG